MGRFFYGATRLARRLRRVVFPAPDGPKIAVTSPCLHIPLTLFMIVLTDFTPFSFLFILKVRSLNEMSTKNIKNLYLEWWVLLLLGSYLY